jgi:hypothetical protein
LAGFSRFAGATTLFDSGPPAFIGTNITQIRAADSFVLGAPATVTDVRFYGSAFSPDNFPGNFSGSIAYAFYNNSAGALGSVIASGTVSGLTGVLSGVCGAGNCYTVDFALNSGIGLAAGTYWLELHEGTALTTSDGSAIAWAGLNNGTGASLVSFSLATAPNTAATTDRAFLLFDNSATSGVPEPSTTLFALAGLGTIAYRRVRRSSSIHCTRL